MMQQNLLTVVRSSSERGTSPSFITSGVPGSLAMEKENTSTRAENNKIARLDNTRNGNVTHRERERDSGNTDAYVPIKRYRGDGD